MSIETPIVSSLANRRELIEKTIKIQTKKRGLQPLILNRMQRDYWEHKTSRDLSAKARQLGFSTLTLADYITDVCTIPGLNVFSIWPDEDAARRMMNRIIKPMIDNLPERIIVGTREILYKPTIGLWNSTTITFPDLQSAITMGSAGSTKFGRGQVMHRTHLSECGFYPPGSFELLKAAAEGGSPKGRMRTSYGYETDASKIVWESTANGRGGKWYELVEQARNGASAYTLHFYPWYFDDEATLPATDTLSISKGLVKIDPTDTELDIIKRAQAQYGITVTMDMLRWRRWSQLEQGKLFLQECAEDLDSSFLFSGNLVFDTADLQAMSAEAAARAVWRTDWNGQLRVWEEPIAGKKYIVIADPSEGLWDDEGAAFSDAIVIRVDTWTHVATIHAKIPPRPFADKLAELGTHYNKALLVPEINNTCGGEVIAQLTNVLHYENIYQQPGTRGTLGWRTHVGNKTGMVFSARDIIHANGFHTYDPLLIGQLYNIINTDRGIDKQEGTFSDLAMCAFIGIAVLQEGYQEHSGAAKMVVRGR